MTDFGALVLIILGLVSGYLWARLSAMREITELRRQLEAASTATDEKP